MSSLIGKGNAFFCYFEKWAYAKIVVFISLMMAILIFAVQLASAFDISASVSSTSVRVVEILFMLYLLKSANVFSLLNNWQLSGLKILSVLIMAVPVVVAIVVNGLSMAGDPSSVGAVLFYLFNMQMVGIYEEFLFRGVVFLIFIYLFVKKNKSNPIYKSMWIVAFLFGIMHIVNLFMGAELWTTVIQIIGASFISFSFCALVIITRNIWIAGILHGLYNSTSFDGILQWTGFGQYINGVIVISVIFSGVWFVFKRVDYSDFIKYLKSYC